MMGIQESWNIVHELSVIKSQCLQRSIDWTSCCWSVGSRSASNKKLRETASPECHSFCLWSPQGSTPRSSSVGVFSSSKVLPQYCSLWNKNEFNCRLFLSLVIVQWGEKNIAFSIYWNSRVYYLTSYGKVKTHRREMQGQQRLQVFNECQQESAYQCKCRNDSL